MRAGAAGYGLPTSSSRAFPSNLRDTSPPDTLLSKSIAVRRSEAANKEKHSLPLNIILFFYLQFYNTVSDY